MKDLKSTGSIFMFFLFPNHVDVTMFSQNLTNQIYSDRDKKKKNKKICNTNSVLCLFDFAHPCCV